MEGSGLVEAGGKTLEIREGCGIFIPAGLEYRFINTTGKPMEAIIIVEGVPAGFKPAGSMTVRNYRDAMPGFCCWAYATYNLFGKSDGLAEPMVLRWCLSRNTEWGRPIFMWRGARKSG